MFAVCFCWRLFRSSVLLLLQVLGGIPPLVLGLGHALDSHKAAAAHVIGGWGLESVGGAASCVAGSSGPGSCVIGVGGWGQDATWQEGQGGGWGVAWLV